MARLSHSSVAGISLPYDMYEVVFLDFSWLWENETTKSVAVAKGDHGTCCEIGTHLGSFSSTTQSFW